MQDLAAGGIEIVTCSLPEGRSLIDAGKARPLAVMSPERTALYPNVPTLKEAIGSNWTVGAWRGIAGPKGMPPDLAGRLSAGIKKVWDGKEFKDFMNNRGFGLTWADAQGYGRFMEKGDADMAIVMKALGLTKA